MRSRRSAWAAWNSAIKRGLVDAGEPAGLHDDLAVDDDGIDTAAAFAVHELAHRHVERHEPHARKPVKDDVCLVAGSEAAELAVPAERARAADGCGVPDLGGGRPAALIGGADAPEPSAEFQGQQHRAVERNSAAVRSHGDVDACVAKGAEIGNARADGGVAPGIVLHGGAGLGDQRAVARREPHAMHEGGSGPQEAQCVEMLDHAASPEDLRGYDLHARLERVHHQRQIQLVRESPARPQEAVGAALRRGGRDENAHSRRGRVMRPGEVAHEAQQVLAARPRQGTQAVQHIRSEALLDERPAVDHRLVDHREADVGTQSRVLVGLQRRIDVAAVERLAEAQVVDDRGRARAQALDGRHHGAQIDVALGQRQRHGRAQMRHDHLHRQVLGPPFDEVIPGMQVAVDKAGCGNEAGGVDAPVASMDGASRRDRGDTVILDQHIDRFGTKGRSSVLHDQRTAQHQLRHALLTRRPRRVAMVVPQPSVILDA